MAIVKCVQEGQDFVQQKSPSFERILTWTCVPSEANAYPRLTLPSWFVRQHGDKMHPSATLQTAAARSSREERWTVQIVVRHPQKNPQVMFYGGGWKDFAACHGLAEGDRLTFTLTAMSEFQVTVSLDGAGDEPIPWPRKRGSKRTRAARRSLAAKSSPSRKLVKKLRFSEEHDSDSVLSSRHSRVLVKKRAPGRFPELEHERDSVLPSHHGASADAGVMVLSVQQEVTVVTTTSSSSLNRSRQALREQRRIAFPLRTPSGPSFVKQIPMQHLHRMEIPDGFYKSYGDRLQADVKLQGIHDGSPVRAVTCCVRSDGRRLRIDLVDGWKAFDSENSLQAGQTLVFTLIANSFFRVRRAQDL